MPCRFDSVAEERRRELFEEYCALLAEAGEMPAMRRQQQVPDRAVPAAEAGMVGVKLAAAGALGGGEEAEDSAQLVQLKAEQDRLKEEYDRWGGVGAKPRACARVQASYSLRAPCA